MVEPRLDSIARSLPLWKGYAPLLLYNGIFLLFALAISPFIVWRLLFDRSYRGGLSARMGNLQPSRSTRRLVWIHGVSVGEVKAVSTLVESIRERYPELDIVVSTTTATGHDLATRIYRELRVVHYPIDFGWFPGLALDRIRPSCILLTELEVWPNFLQAAARRHIPVSVINGRISESSFTGYRLVRALLPQLDWIRRYLVQDEVYEKRLLELGIPLDKISVTGNMKYDNVRMREPAGAAELRAWLSPDGRLVLVCGSTHGREEEWLAAMRCRLERSLDRRIRLVLVPRHPERCAGVLEALEGEGMRAVLWSRSGGGRPAGPQLGEDDIVLVDTIGQLEVFYGACDVAFVGGSLVPHGGQNMLEPAGLGKAVLFGPHTMNFRADVELLLEARAAVQVDGIEQLERTLAQLFTEPELRDELGSRAVELIARNQGATLRTLVLLEPLLLAAAPMEIGSTASEQQSQDADQQQADQGQGH